MKLPSLPFFRNQQSKEYFLSLLFQEEQVQAVIFEEVNKSLRVLSNNSQQLNQPIEEMSFETLLSTLDKAISNAENALPSGIQTQKTIFGLKQEWVENGAIKKDYLLTLKKACEEMDLQPIGFLVFPEAIAHLLQQEEGAPVSAVLLEIGTSTLTATLLRGGRIIESHSGKLHEEDLPASVDKLLSHFVDLEILPSRIIVADDQKRPNLAQQLIHHRWSKQLPFLHVPQITPLPQNFDIQAILHGTATQLGFTVDTEYRVPPPPQAQQFADTPFPDGKEDKLRPPLQEEDSEASDIDEEPSTDAKAMDDMPEEKTPEEMEDFDQDDKEPSTQKESREDFGFVQEKDVADGTDHPTTFASHIKDNAYEESEDELARENFETIPERVKDEEEGLGTKSGSFAVNGMLAAEGMRNVFGRLQKQAKKSNLSLGSVPTLLGRLPLLLAPLQGLLKGPKLLLAIPGVIVLIVVGILWYMFALHATVTLSLNPTPIDASSPITISTKSSTNLSSGILGGESVSVDESGSVTTDATGKKDTGDKAKGTVTLYNSADSSKHFDAGTTITSENNLKFTIDKDVTVASASGDIFSGTKPGTQDVAVTASTFGTDYNLPSGTKFSVSGTSSVAAKNGNAFSGGTKKSLTVVSANDLAKAQDDLITSLQGKAKEDMQKQNGASRTILPIFTDTTLSQKSTDKKEGDEAKSVTLTATATFESIAYTADELSQIAKDLLKDKISDNMTTTHEGIQAQVEDANPTKDGSSAKATLKASAKLIPKLDTKTIASRIAGKSFGDISSTLSEIKELESADVTLSPNLFFLPHTLPRFSQNITVKISE